MVRILSRYPKTIAWFFIIAFYVDVAITPAIANANVGRRIYDGPGAARPPVAWDGVKELAPVVKNPELPVATGKKAAAPRKVDGVVTTGPTQPEMQSFQSVNANNMVDLFTGDFSYNIPLLDVGGYPVNLHYQSGITMDQEASWVGLGWNINPGAITRNMRGLADDFAGDSER